MAELAGDWMIKHKLKFVRKAVPTKVELIEEGPPRRLRVEYKSTETGEISSEEFNTVSREYVLHNLGICAILRLRCAFSESRNCMPISRVHTRVAQSRGNTISVENPGHRSNFHCV